VTSNDETKTVPDGDATPDAAGVEETVSEETVVEDTETERPLEPATRPARAARKWIAPVAAAVVLIAAASAAGWLYFFQYRADQQTDADSSRVALDAAKDGTVALLSYAPETLDQDFATAKSRLTGDFLNYYTDFTEKVVAPAAKQKSVKTEATVAQAAMAEMKPESAVALLFVNQATTSQENPDGAFASSSIKVGLTKVDGAWLISSFDPV
jgi:Mce-associated membrane protein